MVSTHSQSRTRLFLVLLGSQVAVILEILRVRHRPSLLCWAVSAFSYQHTLLVWIFYDGQWSYYLLGLSQVGKPHSSLASLVVNLVWFPSTNGVWLAPITLERDCSLPPSFLPSRTGWFSSCSTRWWERSVKSTSCDYGIISSLILSIFISFILKLLPMHTYLWVCRFVFKSFCTKHNLAF